MLIATRDSIFLLKYGSTKPVQLFSDLDVRRVEEGNKTSIIALSDGTITVLASSKTRKLKTGIKDRIDSLCLINENPLNLLIGTTPPHIYRINESATRVKTFDSLKVRDQWYTPWGGPAAVRSMAKSRDGWIYADIHVGSIMRSADKGENWEPVTPTLHEDVHEVATTSASDSIVCANTYLSVYVSDDHGNSWKHRSNALNNRYGRGIAIHPEDPNVMLCGVSDGPVGENVHGQLYWTDDAGLNWKHVIEGFPKSTLKNIDTFHIAFDYEDVAWVCDEENLYRSRDWGETWSLFWTAPAEIEMLSCKVRQIE